MDATATSTLQPFDWKHWFHCEEIDDIEFTDASFRQFLAHNKFRPKGAEKKQISRFDYLRSFNMGKFDFLFKLEEDLDNYEPSSPWYYSNCVRMELEEWSYTLFMFAKDAACYSWKLQMEQAAEAPLVESGDSFAPSQMKTEVVKWWLTFLAKIKRSDWARVAVPYVPSLGTQLIITKQELYEQWKVIAFRAIVNILLNHEPGFGGEYRDTYEAIRRAVPMEEWELEHLHVVRYPELRMDDSGEILSFPPKEVPGSGLALAEELDLDVNTPPIQHNSHNPPQVGDVPSPGLFPTNISEFSDEDLFRLVVFYNETFALEALASYQTAKEHLYEVWWHLTQLAKDGGRPNSGTFWDYDNARKRMGRNDDKKADTHPIENEGKGSSAEKRGLDEGDSNSSVLPPTKRCKI